MSLVSAIFDAVSYRIFRDGATTISSSTKPTETEALQWLNEDIITIAGICAQEKSELGRTLATITTAIPSISAITEAISTKKPFLSPLKSPYAKRTPRMMSNIPIPCF